MRCYLAGPMSGVPRMNFPRFDEVAADLRSRGYEVVSPAELDSPESRAAALAAEDGDLSSYSKDTGETWGDLLARDVKLLADQDIEAVVVLEGWQKSRGARLETFVARLCGIPVVEYHAYSPMLAVREGEWGGVHGELPEGSGADYIEDPEPYEALAAFTHSFNPGGQWSPPTVTPTENTRLTGSVQRATRSIDTTQSPNMGSVSESVPEGNSIPTPPNNGTAGTRGCGSAIGPTQTSDEHALNPSCDQSSALDLQSMTPCLKHNKAYAPSAGDRNQGRNDWLSTTTIPPEGFGDCFAPSVIQESATCETVSQGWRRPSDTSEHMTTNTKTGGMKGAKESRMELLPWDVLQRDVAPLYAFGSRKYADHNWRKGFDWSLSFGAMMRHASQFWSGEDSDEETGCAHLASVVFHALALLYFASAHPSLDDRPVVACLT